MAFDLLEEELGVPPALTGRELAESRGPPDRLAMTSYLSQVYDVFRKEIPAVGQAARMTGEGAPCPEQDLLEDSQYR